jgi:hypothetical protein
MADFSPVPAGLHKVVIVEAQSGQPTKSGDYSMAVVTFSVLTMGHAGARVKGYHITRGVTPAAKQFPVSQGRDKMASLFKACGKPPGDPSTLVGSQLTVLIQHKSGDDGKIWATPDSYLPVSASSGPSVNPVPMMNPDDMPF